jgi:hypothetical protein
MDKKVSVAVERYQCSGCISGSNTSCFKANEDAGGIGCGNHLSGTYISGIGKILLGLPKGFNRLGRHEDLKPTIFKSFKDFTETGWKEYNNFNRPVWKHLDKHGNTLVRGLMPRRNEPFLHIFLENCISQIHCVEISKEQIDEMD